jgi:hypothetical protein
MLLELELRSRPGREHNGSNSRLHMKLEFGLMSRLRKESDGFVNELHTKLDLGPTSLPSRETNGSVNKLHMQLESGPRSHLRKETYGSVGKLHMKPESGSRVRPRREHNGSARTLCILPPWGLWSFSKRQDYGYVSLSQNEGVFIWAWVHRSILLGGLAQRLDTFFLGGKQKFPQLSHNLICNPVVVLVAFLNKETLSSFSDSWGWTVLWYEVKRNSSLQQVRIEKWIEL